MSSTVIKSRNVDIHLDKFSFSFSRKGEMSASYLELRIANQKVDAIGSDESIRTEDDFTPCCTN